MRRFLTVPQVPLHGALRKYDPDDDDIRSVLVDVTDAWEALGATMIVHVPGRDLRTATDFAVLLEQAPRAIRALEAGSELTLLMYEQTAMLEIDLVPDKPDVRLATRALGKPSRSDALHTSTMPLASVLEDLEHAVALVERYAMPSHELHVRRWVQAWRAGTWT